MIGVRYLCGKKIMLYSQRVEGEEESWALKTSQKTGARLSCREGCLEREGRVGRGMNVHKVTKLFLSEASSS